MASGVAFAWQAHEYTKAQQGFWWVSQNNDNPEAETLP
jgi:hypothetical protein